MPAQANDNKGPQLDLSLGDYNVNDAAVLCSGDGTKFTFTIWPLLDATVTALERVALKHGRICLYCCGRPLSFDLETLERKGPRTVRIAGRIVSGVSDAMSSPRQAGAR